MKASALKGMPVLAINDGLQVGAVDEVLVDPATRAVGALAVGLGGQRHVIAYSAIKSVGADAITVESAGDAAEATAELPLAQLPTLSALAKLSVMDASGNRQGNLVDVEMDPQDGRIVELLVHRGGVMGMGGSTSALPVAALRSLGPQVVMIDTVPPPAEPA